MPGVEVHATECSICCKGNLLKRLGGGTEALLLLLCAAIFAGGLVWLRSDFRKLRGLGPPLRLLGH